LVIKPVAGVLDAVSKTTEGIKNTGKYLKIIKKNLATYFDDKPNENRERNPKVFYRTEKFYT